VLSCLFAARSARVWWPVRCAACAAAWRTCAGCALPPTRHLQAERMTVHRRSVKCHRGHTLPHSSRDPVLLAPIARHALHPHSPGPPSTPFPYSCGCLHPAQEKPEDVPTGELPRTISLVVDRHLVNTVTPGTRVDVVGIYSTFKVRPLLAALQPQRWTRASAARAPSHALLWWREGARACLFLCPSTQRCTSVLARAPAVCVPHGTALVCGRVRLLLVCLATPHCAGAWPHAHRARPWIRRLRRCSSRTCVSCPCKRRLATPTPDSISRGCSLGLPHAYPSVPCLGDAV